MKSDQHTCKELIIQLRLVDLHFRYQKIVGQWTAMVTTCLGPTVGTGCGPADLRQTPVLPAFVNFVIIGENICQLTPL